VSVGGPDSCSAIAYARRRLETELPEWLRYHDLEHTTGFVVPAADLLAVDLALAPTDRALLVTAAWFHDIGFVERYEDNEEVAIRVVREVLPTFRFSDEQVDAVAGAIWATRVPQLPDTPLAEAMCDADLFTLGTDRFFDRNEALREELEIVGVVYTDAQWLRSQMAFLESHRYFTTPAKRRNDAAKAANLAEVRRRLGA
jgi:uncharacterized protein